MCSPYECDFAVEQRRAKGMTIDELNFAIADCRGCIALKINPNKYYDQASVYLQELNKRLQKKARS